MLLPTHPYRAIIKALTMTAWMMAARENDSGSERDMDTNLLLFNIKTSLNFQDGP